MTKQNKKRSKLKILYFLFVVFHFSFFIFHLARPRAVEAAVSLSLSPPAKSVEINQEFTVLVILNTGGANADGADAILNYDAAKLNLASATLGDLFGNKLVANTSVSGKVTLKATSASGTYFSGSGTFATLSFKGKTTGTAAVTFDFKANSTTDSNVYYNGSDILGSVTNGSYTVMAAGTLPTSTPTPVISPSGSVTPKPTIPATGVFNLTLGTGLIGVLFFLTGFLLLLRT